MTNKAYQYYVGIDISKKTLDMAVYKQDKLITSLQVANDNKGVKKFIRQAKACNIDLNKVLFCAEKTGDYGKQLYNLLVKKSYPYW